MRKCLTKVSRIFVCGAVQISTVPTRPDRAAYHAHLLFYTSPDLAALLRSDGFVSGAVCFVRRALARSFFLGFQIGVPRCRSAHV